MMADESEIVLENLVCAFYHERLWHVKINGMNL